MTKLIARCTRASEHPPGDQNHGRFLTTALVSQGWRVDCDGEWIETVEDCFDVYKKPDRDNFECAVNDCDGKVEWIDTETGDEWPEPTEMEKLAANPNLGLLIVQWELREMRVKSTLGCGLPRPALLTVIQRWLRAGCPVIEPGPSPLELLGLIKMGDGDTED